MESPTVNPEALVTELASFIQAHHLEWQEGDWQWTKAVKGCVREVYERNGSSVRCFDRTRGDQEFLLDLCAFSNGRMELAMECEWKPQPERTREDFEKLLHFKAPTKLMVCDSPSFVLDKLKPAVEYLTKYQGHQIGEQYIIFNCRGNRSVINCHSWRVIADGIVLAGDVHFSVVPRFPWVYNQENWEKNRLHSDGWLDRIG